MDVLFARQAKGWPPAAGTVASEPLLRSPIGHARRAFHHDPCRHSPESHWPIGNHGHGRKVGYGVREDPTRLRAERGSCGAVLLAGRAARGGRDNVPVSSTLNWQQGSQRTESGRSPRVGSGGRSNDGGWARHFRLCCWPHTLNSAVTSALPMPTTPQKPLQNCLVPLLAGLPVVRREAAR